MAVKTIMFAGKERTVTDAGMLQGKETLVEFKAKVTDCGNFYRFDGLEIPKSAYGANGVKYADRCVIRTMTTNSVLSPSGKEGSPVLRITSYFKKPNSVDTSAILSDAASVQFRKLVVEQGLPADQAEAIVRCIPGQEAFDGTAVLEAIEAESEPEPDAESASN